MKLAVVCLAWLAFLVGCGSGGASPEQAVTGDVRKLGGTVEHDPNQFDHPVTKVQLHGSHVTDADLKMLEPLTQLKSLSLGRSQITDAGLVHLRELRNLQTLSLNMTEVTDAGLQNLVMLKSLRTLNLQDTRVTEAGVQELKRILPNVAVGYTKQN